MIPKKIHYCWLSNDPLPKKIRNCIDSWKRIMPEYEIILWDKSRFDVSANIFVEQACNEKKWAFAADFIRLHAIYTEGGIYLDSDVFVLKSFDEFLSCGFFSAVEYHPDVVRKTHSLRLLNSDGSSRKINTPIPGIGIQAAVIAGIKGHPFLRDCLEFYKDRHFILGNNEYFNKIIAPNIYAMVAETYGFKYCDQEQLLSNDMLLLSSETFAGNIRQASRRSYAIHLCAGGWRSKKTDGFIKSMMWEWYMRMIRIKHCLQ